MLYSFLKSLAGVVFRTWFRVKADGKEHVPKEGAVIVCCNHISMWDPVVIGYVMPRPLRYMAKAELFRVPLLRQLITKLGAFPVKRGGVSKETIRQSLDLLAGGEMLLIFPEGTRNLDGNSAAKRGAVNLAFKSGAVIIPAAITGTYRPFSKIAVKIGEPVDLRHLREIGTTEAQLEATEIIMQAIHRLKGRS
jgi:1-acyl-sn-glycerol-3-phosphate acyltransferase